MDTTHELRNEPGWGPLAVLMGGIFLVVLDFFIVNVALPSLQTDLHATSSGLEWVVAGYGLTFAALLIAAVRLGERWGRRRVYVLGIGVFVLASAACGAAPTIETLVAARLAQGVGGAMVSPLVLALVRDVYAGGRLARAIGIYSAVMGLAAASGQLIGGALISADVAGLGWRAIFWVNVPVGLAVVAGAPRLLPNRRGAAARVDVAELLLATVTLTALLLPLMEGRRLDWPAWTWASLALAGASAVATYARGRTLVAHGLRPLVDPVAFRSSTVRVAVACQGLLFVGMASYFLVLALYLQLGRGLSALESGLVFTLVAIPYMAGTVAVPRVAARLGTRTVASGAAVFALGHVALWVAVRTDASVADLAPGLVLAGLGMGVALTSLIGAAMTGVEPATVGAVSGVLSTVQQVGNTLGVAVVGMVFFGGVTAGYDVAMAHSLLVLAGTTTAVALLATRLRPAVSSGRGPEVASSARPAHPVGGGARRATG
ncbi:MFS transporter [Nocardioides islandensis]|uniref:MFS transporter n=1 Tax=Nocardioides islandensis TaxID=433663 RepID=A0A930VG80_9ACTN|nr:MFS transporter [Nocardioides islandensis]MBF4764001.1 MFS transporter [Nocardioides islandensis]